MTDVIPLASRRAGTLNALASTTPTTTSGEVPAIERQAAIENALSMALYFMRRPLGTSADLWAATARTNRALTLLKQAGQDAHTRRGGQDD
ncbi:MAG: hypothetical protein JWM47_4426 [Acidimicrobiales bacterium]|nr:hypothetical protein [Acidimicrobiales bacterium]